MKGVHFTCCLLCLAFLLSNSNIVVRKIYFLPFGSGLLLNIAKLRFVHMKGVHFYVLSALLGVLLSNSNIVVRKNILFAFRQRPFTQYCKIEICAHERCAFLRAVCFAWRFY